MKNNLLPSLVMLLAGLVCSIISLRQGVDLMNFTTRLLTVLVVFYIIGATILGDGDVALILDVNTLM